MQKKFARMIILVIIIAIPSFSNENISEDITNEQMLAKIQSLEVEMERLRIESSDNGILAQGATLNWGKGVFIGFNLSPNTGVVSAGYTIGLKERSKNINYPLSQSRDIRYTIGLTGRYRTFEASVDDVPVAASVGILLKMGSPVMLNLISISTFISPNIIWAETERTDNYTSPFTEKEFGLDTGVDIEFWVTSKTMLTIGYLYDPVLFKIAGDADLYDIGEVKFSFGTRFYFR